MLCSLLIGNRFLGGQLKQTDGVELVNISSFRDYCKVNTHIILDTGLDVYYINNEHIQAIGFRKDEEISILDRLR